MFREKQIFNVTAAKKPAEHPLSYASLSKLPRLTDIPVNAI